MDNQERLRRLRKMLVQISPASQVESLGEVLESAHGGGDQGERLDAGRLDDDDTFALETLEVLSRRGIEAPLDEEQQESLEAIVHKRYRPVIFIQNGSFKTPPPYWEHLGAEPHRKRIEEAIPSIGRIELPHHPLLPYGGTGFVVGENLIMTNRHVAALFATGLGVRQLSFIPGQAVGIDFKQEFGSNERQFLTVDKVKMIHPYWDMALIQVSGLPARHPVLRISVDDPENLVDRDVVVIGYPAQDRRNDLNLQNKIFGGMFEVKRMQPGKLKVRREFESFGRNVNAVTHDCSTLGGNSGSAVIDVKTGDVVALHFAGDYLDANYAVPTIELARDSRVVDSGVKFTSSVGSTTFTAPFWSVADSAEAASMARNADPGPSIQSPAPAAELKIAGTQASATWTIPIHVTVDIGTPTLGGAPTVVGPIARPEQRVAPVEGLFRRAPVAAPPIPPFSLASLSATSFKWRTALSLALASNLAYENGLAIQNTACNAWGFSTCQFFEADDTECFMAAAPTLVLVAFRGTANVGDWLTDLNAYSTLRPYGLVHRGFYHGFRVVQTQLEQALGLLQARPILLTGHSLGGALAVVAAAEWQGRFPLAAIFTYGQPCVGKGAFPAFMTSHYPSSIFRMVNDDDIVPRVPPTYQHVGRLFHFDASGNVEQSTESIGLEAASDTPPVLTEAQFDQLRAQLLATRSGQRLGDGTESLVASSQLEGLLPSFSDHRISNYIAKIAAQAVRANS